MSKYGRGSGGHATAALIREIERTVAAAAAAAPMRQIRTSAEDRTYALQQSAATAESPFDVAGLRAEMNAALRTGGATIRTFRQQRPSGATLILVELAASPVRHLHTILRTWGKIFHMFPVQPAARVVWFAHPTPRLLPAAGVEPGPGDINGGYCVRCDPSTIVIYRAEDATRVLIHELLHATCADSARHKDVPKIEAETEAWAEIIHAVVRGGDVAEQIAYSLAQNRLLRDKYGVRGPANYAWRYTVGKEEVWERLGFSLAGVAAAAAAVPRALALTYNPLPSSRIQA